MITKNFKVVWKHNNNNKSNKKFCQYTGKRLQKQSWTQCIVSDRESDEILCVGTSFVHPNDHYVKAVGRVVSVIAAIQSSKSLVEDELMEGLLELSPKYLNIIENYGV